MPEVGSANRHPNPFPIFSKQKGCKIEKELNMPHINDIKTNIIKYTFQLRCPKTRGQTYIYL
jgi:hypothetical protein